jgi:hypothetical protein
MHTSPSSVLAVAVVTAATLAFTGWAPVQPTAAAPDWPAASRQTRPWTRWWWMGSAVDARSLTLELESLRAAGLGGVEITPIYGAAGAEAQFLPYLSSEWVRLLRHALDEARRLDLGVDMATGTGWPFGGPWIAESEACRTLVSRQWTIDGGGRLQDRVHLQQAPLVRAVGSQIYEVLDVLPGEKPPAGTRAVPLARAGVGAPQISDLRDPVEANSNLQALALEQVRFPKPLPLQTLMAYSSAGVVVDLTARVGADGVLDWVAPPGRWTLYAVFLGWHGKLVERAAPGGEGNVIDHFSRDAIRAHLARFDRGFGGRRLSGLRAFFNDSYEVDDAQGQADATPLLFDAFQQRRGYDLRRHLPALFGKDASDERARVLADYRLTISDLLLETFTTEWRAWAARHNAIVRNQAHGSPANLLDLYAASDVPETEGTEFTRAKWASSAAHVAGRALVSAEAATWLGEHFRSTLADIRADLDRFFLAGVNHIVYHGTAYSPPGEPWPGWQFYAAVEFNPRNSWWTDFAALNAYVTRVQSFLQAGRPDHDILLYYPFYDSIAATGEDRLVHFGRANQPLEGSAFERASALLQQRGFTYDYVSDRQLAAARVTDGAIVTSGGRPYKVLVVPDSRFVPLETFERILETARAGATVILYGDFPQDVAGYANLEARRRRFTMLRDGLRFTDDSGIASARVGRGIVHRGAELERLLAHAGIAREALVDRGFHFVRRRRDTGRDYFIANTTDRPIDAWLPLNDDAPAVVIHDPMTGERGDALTRRSSAGMLEVHVTLPRQSSVILATTRTPVGWPFVWLPLAAATVDSSIAADGAMTGAWDVRFVSGGPTLPRERHVATLASWTTFDGEDVKAFSGTGVYTTRFFLQGGGSPWILDLGRVHDSARVRLNGRDLGTLIGPDFRLRIDSEDLLGNNVLEIHVSNLMANRIAALDRQGVRWRRFYNVNFPARLPANRGPDGLFSAAGWEPLESGLLGPVQLFPLRPR